MPKGKPKYSCPCCMRKYVVKTYFDRHVAACELVHQTKKERKQDIEALADTPDHRQLYEMVLALATKNKELEEKIATLEKWANIRKKRLHVKDWLDENYKEVASFDEVVNELRITKDHFEIICEYDYVEGISMILKEYLPLENEADLPIKAFDQKDNVLFVKKKDGWETMNPDELNLVITGIAKKIMDQFVQWQEINSGRTEQDKYQDLYVDRLQKVLGSNFKKDQIFTKIRRNMYKHLKMNLKNVVQFEFMF